MNLKQKDFSLLEGTEGYALTSTSYNDKIYQGHSFGHN